MDVAVKLLSSYSGRDKIMRTTGYVAMFISGSTAGKVAKDFGVIAKQVSAARTIGRLFDDILAWTVVKNYGFGMQERDPVIRVLQIFGNLSGSLLYFVCEHVAWLADNEVLTIESKRWWAWSIQCWAFSLLCAILRGLRNIAKLRLRRVKLLKQRRLESPETNQDEHTQSLKELTQQQRAEVLALLKNIPDLINAVSWFPQGVLWSGKLSRTQNGLLGTFASLVGLYVAIQDLKKTATPVVPIEAKSK